MSKIAKLCQVSVVAVLNWIKKAALNVAPLTGISSSDIVMIDEMWHFVNGKKTRCGSGAPLMASRVSLWDGKWAIVGIQPWVSSLTSSIPKLVSSWQTNGQDSFDSCQANGISMVKTWRFPLSKPTAIFDTGLPALSEDPNVPQDHLPWSMPLLPSTITFKSRIIYRNSSQLS